MTPEEITEYLKIGEAPPKVWKSFLREMNLKRKGSKPAKRITNFPVKIRRDAPSRLHPFSEYFLGFERVGAVRELFGDATDDVLRDLKVEFIDSPFPTIYPNEDDGHLIVASGYFRKGPVSSLYLDAFVCLNLLKALSAGGESPDPDVEFADNPAVFQAYGAMVKEARRLGLADGKILGHLQLMRFMMNPPEFKRFLKAVGLKASDPD